MLMALCAAYLCGLGALVCVAGSKRLFARWYVPAKLSLSCGFVLAALAAALYRGSLARPFTLGLLPCLVLCALGDAALGMANTHRAHFKRWMMRGAGAFAAAHAGFCALFTLAPPGAGWHWQDAAVCAGAVCITGLCAHSSRFALRRMHMTVPGLVYSACVGLMGARSAAFALARSFDRQGVLACLGAALFLLSDAVLLVLYFYHRPPRAARAANLILYYLGVFCLALAVCRLKASPCALKSARCPPPSRAWGARGSRAPDPPSRAKNRRCCRACTASRR